MSEVCSKYARDEECLQFYWQLLNGREELGEPGSRSSLDLEVICLSGFITAVAVFRKPNAIHLCFSIDLVPNFLLSWLLVLLLSTFF